MDNLIIGIALGVIVGILLQRKQHTARQPVPGVIPDLRPGECYYYHADIHAMKCAGDDGGDGDVEELPHTPASNWREN